MNCLFFIFYGFFMGTSKDFTNNFHITKLSLSYTYIFRDDSWKFKNQRKAMC